MLDYTEIGKKIRSLRRARNLSQEQLAEKIWISTTHMSHIETGSTKLSLPVLVDLANTLQVGTDEILGTMRNVEGQATEDRIRQLLSTCNVAQAKVLEDILLHAKEAIDHYL